VQRWHPHVHAREACARSTPFVRCYNQEARRIFQPLFYEGTLTGCVVSYRASEARKHIPDEFKIVSLFGWTMGGVYLVRYSDSPVGAFDELVVLAGLVWNPPTSCAWAQRVYVSNKIARDHGLQSVGLPSRLARFSQSSKPHTLASKVSARQVRQGSWWCGAGSSQEGRKVAPDCAVVVQNMEKGKRGLKTPVAEFLLPEKFGAKGPRLPLTLPNFSGGTEDHPGLLHYTCKMLANIRPVPALKAVQGAASDVTAEDVSHVLKGKPLMCLAFSDLIMRVPKAQPWTPKGCSRDAQPVAV
jgi:hypothetical protein